MNYAVVVASLLFAGLIVFKEYKKQTANTLCKERLEKTKK